MQSFKLSRTESSMNRLAQVVVEPGEAKVSSPKPTDPITQFRVALGQNEKNEKGADQEDTPAEVKRVFTDEDVELEDVEETIEDSSTCLDAWLITQFGMFLLGAALIAAGVTIELVQDEQSWGRILDILGAFACLILWSTLTVTGCLMLFEGLLRVSTNPDIQRMFSTIHFYLAATQHRVSRLVYLIFAICVVVGIAPRSAGAVVESWQPHYDNFIRALIIIMLVVLAQVITVGLRTYFSQGFNTRAYADRVAKTMHHELILYTLQGMQPTPLFMFLYSKVIDTPTEGKGLDPRAWHRVARYIDTHEVDGFLLPGGYKHARLPPGEEAAYSSFVAPKLAKRLFDRIYAFCEARRAIEKTRENQEEHPLRLRRTLSADNMHKTMYGKASTPVLAGDRNMLASPSQTETLRLAGNIELVRKSDSIGSIPSSRRASLTDVDWIKARQSGGQFIVEDVSVGSSSSDSKSIESARGDRMSGWLKRKTEKAGQQQKAQTTWARAPDGRMVKIKRTRTKDRRRISRQELAQVLHEMYETTDLDVDSLWKEYLDPAGTGFVTLKAMQKMVRGFFLDRTSLSITLQDAGKVLKEVWVGLSGALVAWSFIFGNTVKTAFENVIFLFVVHPFDCGDHLDVGDPPTRMEVLRIHLYATELLRWDGSVMIMENRILANTPIYNYKMSNNRGRAYIQDVDLDCISTARLVQMRKELKEFLLSMPDKFSGIYVVHARTWHNPLKCQLLIYAEYAYPHTNLDRSFDDESVLLEFLCELLVRHKMRFTGSGLGIVGGAGAVERQVLLQELSQAAKLDLVEKKQQ